MVAVVFTAIGDAIAKDESVSIAGSEGSTTGTANLARGAIPGPARR